MQENERQLIYLFIYLFIYLLQFNGIFTEREKKNSHKDNL